MTENLLEKVRGINLKGGEIDNSAFAEYETRVVNLASDCCYGADCGDCDCGGYCIDP